MIRLCVKTPIMLPAGYVDWVHSWRCGDGQPFYVLGDHQYYCPVKFEVWQ